MGALRNATIPRKYNTEASGYTPDYPFDTLDPQEVASVMDWALHSLHVGLTPINVTNFTSTNTDVVVTANGKNFKITRNVAGGAFDLTSDAEASVQGWHIITFNVATMNNNIVLNNATGDEVYVIAGGINENSSPEYDDCNGRVTYALWLGAGDIGSGAGALTLIVDNMNVGDELHINDVQYYSAQYV